MLLHWCALCCFVMMMMISMLMLMMLWCLGFSGWVKESRKEMAWCHFMRHFLSTLMYIRLYYRDMSVTCREGDPGSLFMFGVYKWEKCWWCHRRCANYITVCVWERRNPNPFLFRVWYPPREGVTHTSQRWDETTQKDMKQSKESVHIDADAMTTCFFTSLWMWKDTLAVSDGATESGNPNENESNLWVEEFNRGFKMS